MERIFDALAFFVLGMLISQVVWWLVFGVPPMVSLICKLAGN